MAKHQESKVTALGTPLAAGVPREAWGYLCGSFCLHEPAPQHGLDVDVAQLTVRLQDLRLHLLLQQQPSQPPVEEGAGVLPLQDVLKKWGQSPGWSLQKEEELLCSDRSVTARTGGFEGSSAGLEQRAAPGAGTAPRAAAQTPRRGLCLLPLCHHGKIPCTNPPSHLCLGSP